MKFGYQEISILSVFCLEYFCYFKTIKNLKKDMTGKQKAHIISIKNSLTMTLASIFYIYLFINSGFKLSLNKDNTIFGHLIILYFMAYLLMDLFVGIFEYPNYIEILSGYIHHIVYLFISGLSLYYDTDILYIFILAMFEEIPTLLLAIGSFDSKYRNDKIFGITFFITRIIYHSILMFLFYKYTLSLYVSLGALILHLYWFKNWWKKYGKKIFEKKKEN